MRVLLPSVDVFSWYGASHIRRHVYNVHRSPIKAWELLLTFDQELEYFWCRPFSWSKALFFSVSLLREDYVPPQRLTTQHLESLRFSHLCWVRAWSHGNGLWYPDSCPCNSLHNTSLFYPSPPARVSAQLSARYFAGLTCRSACRAVVSDPLIRERSTEYGPSVVPTSMPPPFTGPL